MKFFSLVFLTVLVTVRGFVQEISPGQFDSFVAEHINDRSVAVLMHVDWCGACKRTLPFFIKAGETSDAALAHIDVTDASDFTSDMKLSGYPALRVLAKGSDPNTHFSEWVSVPYYSRDATGIKNFIDRVSGNAFVEISDESDIKRPRFGLLSSLLISGNLELLPNVGSLKTRFQLVTGHISDEVCAPVSSSEICVAIAPAEEVVVESLRRLPLLKTNDKSQVGRWIDTHAFPGLWKIQDGRFQMFNEQEVFKALIVQDPSYVHSSDINETIIAEVGKCLERLEGRVSFGIISGPDFEDAMNEFGLTRPTWPSVLMLTNARLDYDRYFSDLHLSSLCSDIDSALAGEKELKFRGGLGSKIRHSWRSFIKTLGLESDASKAAALFGSILAITLFAAWALNSCFEDHEKKKSE